jgi:DNA-binding transcriptional ArsR family regulator
LVKKLANIKYIKNPGYICDLMFVFTLQFNKDVWLKRFVNLDKGNEDISFYTDVLDRFPKSSDELLLFFYLMEDRAAFLTQYYFNNYTDIFDQAYDFKFLCDKLSTVEILKENIIRCYFKVNDDGMKEISKLPLSKISMKIYQLDFSDKIKQLLIMFFIDPEYFSKKLAVELAVAETVLDRYYKDNYATIIDIGNKMDFEKAIEATNEWDNLSIDIKDLKCEYYSCCIISVNIFKRMFSRGNPTFIVGKNGLEFWKYLNKQNSNIKLDKFGKIFSEPNRIKILKMLTENEELYTSEIAQRLSLTVTAAYYHLEMMVEVKMLYSRSEGRSVFFRINDNYFKAVVNEISKLVEKDGDKK